MAKQLTVCILMRDKTGRGPPSKEGEKSWQCTVNRGELILEIPEEERETKPEKGQLAANYRLYSEPEIVFYARPADVAPLEEGQLDYLLAVQPANVRLQEYLREDKKKEKTKLIVGDRVMFKLSTQPKAPDSIVNGIIRYIGPFAEQEGFYFGIEILEEQYRGKGTCNGRPHFNCDPNNAVYVAMNKIAKKSEFTPNVMDQSGPVVTKEPTSQNPALKGGPAHNTRSQTSIGKRIKDIVRQIDGTAQAVEASDDTSSQFKVGDRVVLQSAKENTITGTVRWVGPIKVSREVNATPIPVVGVETDRSIDPDADFPDLHINLGPSGTKCFKVSSNHSRVFLPEMLVVHAETFAEQKEKENNTQYEAKVAKEYGLSLEEYRSQKEWIDKANLHRDADHDRKHAPDPPIGGETNEEKSVAGGGTLTDNQLLDSVALVKSGQQPSEEQIERQRQIMEQIQSQRQETRKPHEDTPSADYQGRNGADDNRSQHTSSNLDAIKEGEGRENYSPRAAPRSTNRSPRTAHRDIDNGGPTSLPSYSNTPNHQFTTGSMVYVVTQRGPPLYGVVKWIGTTPGFPETIAGLELEESLPGYTDGTWQGRRFFNCPPGRAYFCPVTALEQDTRYIDEGQIAANLRDDLKNPLADKAPTMVEEDIMFTPELFPKYIGDKRGIQGHHNSCYLDSTVFGLFALSESFDELLLEEPREEVGRQVKYHLWKGIVNPLRKYGLARHESVMSLRNSLEEFGRMKGAKTDEKDPEEFLNMLFKEVLHVEPFLSIKRPFGVEKEYFIQLFFEIDPKETQIPKTDKLLVQMFHEQNISFTRVPSKLLLQMPRFGKDFKMYNRIIPSLTLDVKPLLDPSSRGSQECYFCLEDEANIVCYNCPKEIAHTNDPYLFYCTVCNERAHWKRKGHRVEEVTAQAGAGDVGLFSKLQLLSVICIETSHYVCYTRSEEKWLFHDSMADRYYDMYNIPKVVDVTQELQDWVYSEKGTEKLMTSPAKSIPEYVRRFTQDIYMCVYVNTDLDLYGAPDASMLAGVTGGTHQEEKHLLAELRDRHDDHPNQDRARQGGGGDDYYWSEDKQRHHYERDRGGACQEERNLPAESDRRDVHSNRADQDRARQGGGGNDYYRSEDERRHHYNRDRGGAHQGERNLSDHRDVPPNRVADHEGANWDRDRRGGGGGDYYRSEDERRYHPERDRGQHGVSRGQHGYHGNGGRYHEGSHHPDSHRGAYQGRGGFDPGRGGFHSGQGGDNYEGQGGSNYVMYSGQD